MAYQLENFILLIAQDKLDITFSVERTGLKFKKMYITHSWVEACKIMDEEPIDIIITDLHLPDAQQNDIIKKLKEIDAIKIVVLTKDSPTENLSEIRNSVDDFLYYGDCNEISLKKSILNITKKKRIRQLYNRVKENLALVPDIEV